MLRPTFRNVNDFTPRKRREEDCFVAHGVPRRGNDYGKFAQRVSLGFLPTAPLDVIEQARERGSTLTTRPPVSSGRKA
jgi:hypothetical protein